MDWEPRIRHGPNWPNVANNSPVSILNFERNNFVFAFVLLNGTLDPTHRYSHFGILRWPAISLREEFVQRVSPDESNWCSSVDFSLARIRRASIALRFSCNTRSRARSMDSHCRCSWKSSLCWLQPGRSSDGPDRQERECLPTAIFSPLWCAEITSANIGLLFCTRIDALIIDRCQSEPNRIRSGRANDKGELDTGTRQEFPRPFRASPYR